MAYIIQTVKFDFSLHLEFILYCMITLTLFKLVCYTKKVFRNRYIWLQEIGFRNEEVRVIYENGIANIIYPNRNRVRFMSELRSIVINLWMVQQFILILLLIDSNRWNKILDQIMISHELSGIPAPNIEYDTIYEFTSWWVFLKMCCTLSFSSCGLLLIIDLLLEKWRRICPLLGFNTSYIYLIIFIISVWLIGTNSIIYEASRSEFHLKNLLKENVEVVENVFFGLVKRLIT